jgi:Domain of unknown function (DUF4145)
MKVRHYGPSLLSGDSEGGWNLTRRTCPSCGRFIFKLQNGKLISGQQITQGQSGAMLYDAREMMVWPKGISRAPLPKEVPPTIAEDYKEACLVLSDSPKASAALSRRCLQNLLRTAAEVKHGDLNFEIQQVIDSGKLPSTIAENIDAIRNIGNFAAHPNKSKSTAEIVSVEPDEAEWNLDVLESLFDVYFVQPARAKAKRDALNKKLTDAGKRSNNKPAYPSHAFGARASISLITSTTAGRPLETA